MTDLKYPKHKIFKDRDFLTSKVVVRGDRGNQYTGGKSQNPTSAIPSFVKDTSQKTGKSETVIKESIQRATNIIPEADQVLQQANINKTGGINT